MTTPARQAAQGLILCIALAVFWIACVSAFHVHEMLVGLGALMLSAAFSLFVVRTLPLQFRPSLSDLLQALRLPWYVIVDVGVVLLVLARDFAGHRAPSLFRSAPWAPVRNNGQETAKRVLAVAYTTVSPNCVVIGIDCRQHQIFFHQLKAAALSPSTTQLGAEKAP